MTKAPYKTAFEQVEKKRNQLRGKGNSTPLAKGATKWALKVAHSEVSPEESPGAFREELEKKREQSNNWITGLRRGLSR